MAETKLTPQQQAVVENRGGTLLVSAAAGSGKTKVLVDRVMRRITDEGMNIHEFLIITFTNAAAAELRMKISAAINGALARDPGNRHLSRQLNLLHLSQISTVHAFCGALLRQYGYRLELPADCRLLEDSERERLLEKQLAQVLEDAYETGELDFLLLTDTLGAGRTDETLGQIIRTVYDKLQGQPDPDRWLKERQFTIDPDTDLTHTPWGETVIADARRQLEWLIQRYRWAVEVMEGDELLEKSYLPAYRGQLSALEGMLPALEGPWDEIAPRMKLEYPRVSVRGYQDQELLDAVKAVKNEGKKQLESIRRLFARCGSELRQEQNALAPALSALVRLVRELDRRFSAEKRRKNLLDFSDQEHLAIRLLVRPEQGGPTEVAREVAAGYREIMVDEYQDSNRVQETIFTAIAAGKDENRFLVGDVKQSIYGFRQAEPQLFLEKYRIYPGAEQAETGSPRKLILSRNFRSRPEILEAVNHTFRTVMSETVGDVAYGADEALYPGLEAYPETGRTHVELHVLELSKLPPDSEETKYQREAQWVAGRIIRMLRDGTPVREGNVLRPVRPEDIAVLLRTRDPIGIYTRVLRQAGVPVASDRGEMLFEAPEVRVLRDLLRVLSNPHQDIPLLAVLCSPLFRLSNDQLAAIRAGSRSVRFYDAMGECGEPWCREVLETLEALRRRAGTMSADHLVWVLLHETGLLSAYSAMENGVSRRENLLRIYELAREGAAEGYLYLYQLNRLLDRAEEAGTMTSASGSGVILTTMHRSKGLEYPVVFLSDLSRKFNFRELSEPVLFDGELGLAAKITDPELGVRYPGLCYEAVKRKKQARLRSEEIRILYVAMTRPKDYLIMTYAGESLDGTLSRLRAGAGQPAAEWAAAGAGCLGDWVLLSALNRAEAGELFARCGRPEGPLTVQAAPWEITLERVDQLPSLRYETEGTTEKTAERLPTAEELKARLTWSDPHWYAARTPSKLTATQLKGRDKDSEAAEGAGTPARLPQLRRPEFVLESRGLSPTEKGTAVHLFLQYARFEACGSRDGVEEEKLRLEDGEYLTPAQLEAVDPEMILRLFQSDLGKRLCSAGELVREFKFSILDDAGIYDPKAAGEELLLQGVVDAAILEEDGITVIDFKTDRVTEGSAQTRAEAYRGQLSAYRRALERIFNRPVKEAVLYFLSVGKAVSL